MNYLVTRHAGALAWLKQQVSAPFIHLTHLEDPSFITHGDMVYGTLPINLVAKICNQGARYKHLCINVPASLRGQEVSAEQLQALGAELVEYYVQTSVLFSLRWR